MFRRTELMRKVLVYVPNIFLELPQKFGSNRSANEFDTAKKQKEKKKLNLKEMKKIY